MSATPVPPATGQRRAAPLVKRILSQGTYETKAVLRNPEQLLVIIGLPVIVLIGLAGASIVSIDTGGLSRVAVVAPGVFALAIMASSFTSQAIATAFDRRNGVLRLMATTPLGQGGLLAGKILAVVAVQVLQFLLVGVVALIMGWSPAAAGIPIAVVGWLLGATAFTSFAFLLAGTMRAEAVIALSNLLLVGLAALGVVLPCSELPVGLAQIAAWLPSGALGELMRAALAHGQMAWGPCAALVVWAGLLAGAASRYFRWDS